jgi:hypothetical protein
MRYRVAIDPLKNVHYTPPDKRDPAVLLAQTWPEPFAYAAADPSLIKSGQFEFSKEGLEKACQGRRWPSFHPSSSFVQLPVMRCGMCVQSIASSGGCCNKVTSRVNGAVPYDRDNVNY